MSQEFRINGLFHLLINGIYSGSNPLILTFHWLKKIIHLASCVCHGPYRNSHSNELAGFAIAFVDTLQGMTQGKHTGTDEFQKIPRVDNHHGDRQPGNTPYRTRTPEIAGLMIRAYENPLVSLNKALLSPYFWGGYVRGG